MSGNKKIYECFICGSKFQMEEHVYGGKKIEGYDIIVCITCWKTNWDGWPGDKAEKIIKHLKERNIHIPPLNEKGWLPRGD